MGSNLLGLLATPFISAHLLVTHGRCGRELYIHSKWLIVGTMLYIVLRFARFFPTMGFVAASGRSVVLSLGYAIFALLSKKNKPFLNLNNGRRRKENMTKKERCLPRNCPWMQPIWGARYGFYIRPTAKWKCQCLCQLEHLQTLKTITPDELKALGSGTILANTYHLSLRPGVDLIDEGGWAFISLWIMTGQSYWFWAVFKFFHLRITAKFAEEGRYF